MRRFIVSILALALCVGTAFAEVRTGTPAKTKPNIQPDAQRPIATWKHNSVQDKALFDAIAKKDINKVRETLKKGANPNAYGYPPSYGKLRETPLSLAIEEGQTEIVAELIKAGGNVNQRVHGGTPLLNNAIWHPKKEIVEMLLVAGANPNLEGYLSYGYGYQTALDEALYAKESRQKTLIRQQQDNKSTSYTEKDIQAIDSIIPILKSAGTVQAKDKVFSHALVQAAEKGNLQKVEKLLDKGIPADARDNKNIKEYKPTAFWMAVINNHFDVADLLLARGADIGTVKGVTDNLLRDIVFNAQVMRWTDEARQKDFEQVQYLLNKGADPNQTDVLQKCYEWVNKYGSREDICALLFVVGNADINGVDADGHTALFYATANGLLDSQKLLLAYGATPLTKQDMRDIEVFNRTREEKYKQTQAEYIARQKEAKKNGNNGFWDNLMNGLGAVSAGYIGNRAVEMYAPTTTTRTVTTTVVEEGVEAASNATATTCAEQCRQSAAENAHIHYRGASGTVPYCTCDVCDDRLQKC